MKLRILTLVVFIFGLVPRPYGLTPEPAQANTTDWSYISTDVDGDGLPNTTEETGWCNALGCFVTDPFDLDSDNDGLTDGEEKLFDSNPKNDSSPGIYIIYDEAYQTQEYYPWQPYGNQLIARADSFIPTRPDEVDLIHNLGTNLDAVVVRRGTTISIGGPINQSLQITENGNLTNLNPQQDPLTGLWQITIPANGTVGQYTLTLGNESMDMFVIFELPTPSGELTQSVIDKFLYDDNPNTLEENYALMMSAQSEYWDGHGDTDPNNPPTDPLPVTTWWLNTNPPTRPPYDIPPGEDFRGKTDTYMVEGGTYKFDAHVFNRYILEDYVMPAMSGADNQEDAADALVEKVDQETVFRNPVVYYDSWKTFKAINDPVDPRNQCSNVSGAVTSLTRAAGLPSRVLFTDWRRSTFDHANEVWVDGQWMVYRGYTKVEMGNVPDNSKKGCSEPAWPACGYDKKNRQTWGTKNYTPWHSGGGGAGNIIATVDETWNLNNQTTRAYRWPSWITEGNKWGTTMLKKDYFETVHEEYWSSYGWNSEPTALPFNSIANHWPDAPPLPPPAPELLTDLGALSALATAAPVLSPIETGNVVAEYGLDLNGNGQYDQLVVEIEVTAAQPGPYWFYSELKTTTPTPTLDSAGGLISSVYQQIPLVAGPQVVQLVFGGQDISTKRVDGPYLVSGLWVTDAAIPAPEDFMNNNLASDFSASQTAAYLSTEFETNGALLNGQYNYTVEDSDSDGLADTLVINTGLTIDQPDQYKTVGTLYDRDANLVSVAEWSGTGPEVSLRFENLAGTVGPYTLRQLELHNSAQASIDIIYDAYTIDIIPELVTATAASFELYGGPDAVMAFGVGITPTTSFNTSLQNGDLRLDAEVEVSQSGSYKLEAWLADQNGNLVTWAVGSATALTPGVKNLSVTFDGANILARGIPGPYKIVALKVLNGSVPYSVIDEVGELPQQTQAYQLSSFAASPDATIVFEDYAESGPGKWSPQAPWAIENDVHQYLTVSKAWSADNAEAALTIAQPLNLEATGYTMVDLKFSTSYDFGSGEAGYVEVSTNGSTWTPVATYSGSASWSQAPQLVDLTAYAGQAALRVRFRLAATGGSWNIDDVVIVAKGEDTDGDGISDEDEGTGDTDGDTIPDYLDDDSDGDGIPDADEGAGDTDDDGTPNYQDSDSDGDGVPDQDEGTGDTDGDTIPNYLDDDSDGDGIPDEDERTSGGLLPHCGNQGGIDTDDDGTPNCRDNDVDGDGIPNYLDDDSDGDGKTDKDEGLGDSDSDSIPNYLDSEDQTPNFGIILTNIYLPIVVK